MLKRRNEALLRRDRKNKENGFYYIYWTEAGRSKELSTRTVDYQEALKIKANWDMKRFTPNGFRELDEVEVEFVLNRYVESRKHIVKDPLRIEIAAKHLVKFFDKKSIHEVTEQSCYDYGVDRGKKPGTIKRELGVLSAALEKAFKDRIVNFAVKVYFPKVPTSHMKWLTRQEANSLLTASKNSEHLFLFINIGLLTGRRKNSILNLKWSSVDFENKVIRWLDDDEIESSKRKPPSRLPENLVTILLEQKKKYPNTVYVVTYDGSHLLDLKNSFSSAVKRAGLDVSGVNKVTPHTLRHTCATWLMQSGQDKFEVAGYLGMTIETLERRYAHHHPGFQKSVANAINLDPD